MSYILKTNYSNAHNYGGYRPLTAIDYIVIHYTAMDGDFDESNANYFHNNALPSPASAHAFVDDDSITISVDADRVAYAVGGSKWADCDTTGGGTLYKRCTNYNSYSIEMCDTIRNGVHDVSAKTRENAMHFVVAKMLEFNVSIDHVVRHFDVNGKYCPGIKGWYGPESTEWYKFKEDIMPILGKEIYESLQKYLITQEAPKDIAAKIEEAKKLGLTDGNNLMLFTPRYQCVLMNLAAYKKGLHDA